MNTKNSKKETIIITGVTGQMGSWLADYFLGKDFDVIGTVRRLSVPNHDNIEHINNRRFRLELMDLGDSYSIDNLINLYKPDYFINCAANSFVADSWKSPAQYFDYNSLGVLRQLEAINRFSPKTKYLNFGSSEEFGDVQYSPQDEKHPLRARSPYGASKIAARQIVKVYRESYKLYAVQPWCFNYESERRGKQFITRKVAIAVANAYHSIKNNCSFRPVEVGNLEARRDWSYAVDFIDGIWKMLNQNPDNLKEYVFASGENHTIREFIETAFAIVGIKGEWMGKTSQQQAFWHISGPKGAASRDSILVQVNQKFYRQNELEILLGDSSLARKELGWAPTTSFHSLVQKMVEHEIKL